MCGAGNGMATEAVAHGLTFDVILMFVKNNRYGGVMVNFISSGEGGREAVGSDEEGYVSNMEGGGAGVGAAP